jgi:hypothetical protein
MFVLRCIGSSALRTALLEPAFGRMNTPSNSNFLPLFLCPSEKSTFLPKLDTFPTFFAESNSCFYSLARVLHLFIRHLIKLIFEKQSARHHGAFCSLPWSFSGKQLDSQDTIFLTASPQR